jgi:hypothetical protein
MLAGALAVAVPGAARADDPAAEREAQARFEEGIARVKAGNFEGARVSFLQAHAVLRKPYILWNLALAEEKTGNVLDALGHFKQFVRLSLVDGAARGQNLGDDRAGAQRHVGELMGLTGHLDVAAPAGTQVIVDGAPAGLAPLADSVDVMPGRHHLEVRPAQSAKPADAEVAAGQLVRVSLVPPETIPPPPVTPGGGDTSTAVATGATAPAGYSGDTPPEANGSPASRAIIVALLGAAAAGSVAVGAYLGLQSQSDASTAEGFRKAYGPSGCFQMPSRRDVCTLWNDAVQAQGRNATLSNVFYVAGGALAAAGVATWVLWPKTSKSAVLTPLLGPAGAGFSAAGRF